MSGQNAVTSLSTILSSTAPPYVLVAVLTPAELMELDDTVDAEGKPVVVRFLDAARMRTDEALFDEYAAALQFPWYFGRNWDAWYDCMVDPYWTASMRYGDAYLVAIYRGSELFADEADPRERLGHFLVACVHASEELAEEQVWSYEYTEPPHPLHTLIQFEAREELARVVELCRERGVAFLVLDRELLPKREPPAPVTGGRP